MSEDKIYKDTDRIHIALWKQLLHFGCARAAVGLLDDVFRLIVPGKGEEEGEAPSAVVDARALSREDAMVMLDDRDGSRLREWLALYQSDRATWENAADEWVEHCRQHDVFGQ